MKPARIIRTPLERACFTLFCMLVGAILMRFLLACGGSTFGALDAADSAVDGPADVDAQQLEATVDARLEAAVDVDQGVDAQLEAAVDARLDAAVDAAADVDAQQLEGSVDARLEGAVDAAADVDAGAVLPRYGRSLMRPGLQLPLHPVPHGRRLQPRLSGHQLRGHGGAMPMKTVGPTFSCLFCSGAVQVLSTREDEAPNALLHSVPECRKFLELDVLEFIKASNVALANRRGVGVT